MVEGKVIGNINSVSVILRGSGSIFGNISCKSFFADAGSTIVGSVNIHKESPLLLDSNLNVIYPGEDARLRDSASSGIEMGVKNEDTVGNSGNDLVDPTESMSRNDSVTSEMHVSSGGSQSQESLNVSQIPPADNEFLGHPTQEKEELQKLTFTDAVDPAVNVDGDAVNMDGSLLSADLKPDQSTGEEFAESETHPGQSEVLRSNSSADIAKSESQEESKIVSDPAGIDKSITENIRAHDIDGVVGDESLPIDSTAIQDITTPVAESEQILSQPNSAHNSKPNTRPNSKPNSQQGSQENLNESNSSRPLSSQELRIDPKDASVTKESPVSTEGKEQETKRHVSDEEVSGEGIGIATAGGFNKKGDAQTGEE